MRPELAERLCREKEVADYFEALVALGIKPAEAAKWTLWIADFRKRG